MKLEGILTAREAKASGLSWTFVEFVDGRERILTAREAKASVLSRSRINPRRFQVHFTPTSSSWLNQVERWFGLITERMMRRGTFHSVAELEHAIYKWLANWNQKPQTFVWKATAEVILDKVRRCKELNGTAH